MAEKIKKKQTKIALDIFCTTNVDRQYEQTNHNDSGESNRPHNLKGTAGRFI